MYFLASFKRYIMCNISTERYSKTNTFVKWSWKVHEIEMWSKKKADMCCNTRVGTLIVASIDLQLIQNRYMFRSFTVLQCSHQHCVQPVASDVEVVGYL